MQPFTVRTWVSKTGTNVFEIELKLDDKKLLAIVANEYMVSITNLLLKCRNLPVLIKFILIIRCLLDLNRLLFF